MPKMTDDDRYMEEGAEYYDYMPGKKVGIVALGVVFAAACLAIAHCAKPEKTAMEYVEAVPVAEHNFS